jgi:V/A-type H+/Na+-transporting ATPase subunit I
MPWPEPLRPVRMARIALVATVESLRDVLAVTADTGLVELEPPQTTLPAGAAARLLQQTGPGTAPPVVARFAPDLDVLVRDGRADLLAGEAEVQEHMAAAVTRGSVAALTGWTPEESRPALAARLAGLGGAVVTLPHPRGSEAPTLLPGRGVRRSLTPLVQMYGTVPYRDLDPAPLAWAAYVLMFGMMFGDAGHGLMLLAGAAMLVRGRPRFLARFRRAWPFVAGAGVTSIVFGVLYGEFFGPTQVIHELWLDPLASPIELLAAAIGVGAVLLAAAYAVGTANRWREGGWPAALYDPSGVAGSSAFLGLGALAGGIYLAEAWLTIVGALLAAAGLVLAFTGFLASAGGSGTGLVQSTVELFDLVVRLGANVVSFARLAAFGLTHAALAKIVWDGTTSLWSRGGFWWVLAGVAFLGGTAVAFALEALVAGVQALRLEYYELFSRVFRTQGRTFRPWHIPMLDPDPVLEESCPQS